MDDFEVLLTSDDSGQLFNVNVWNLTHGQSLTMFKGGTSALNTLCTIGGDFIVSAQTKKAVLQVYEINRKSQQSRKIVVPGVVKCLTVNHKNTLLAAGVGENVLVWELNGGELLAILQRHYQDVVSLSFTNDGMFLLSGGMDSIITMWNVVKIWDKEMLNSNGMVEPDHCFTSHVLGVTSIKCGLKNRVFSASLDRTVQIHDCHARRTLMSLSFDTGLTCLSVDPSELKIFCGGVNGDLYEVSLQQCDAHVDGDDDSNRRITKAHEKTMTCITASCDGSLVITGSEDNTVKIWDTTSMQCIRTIPHKGSINNVQVIKTPHALLSHNSKCHLPFPQLSRVIATDPNEKTMKYFRLDKNKNEGIESDDNTRMQKLIDQCKIRLLQKQEENLPAKKLKEENAALAKENKRLLECNIDKILNEMA